VKVFTNHTDWVVAGDLVACQAIVEAQYGATFEQEGWTIDEWGEVPPDESITISNFNDGGSFDKVTKTAAEWAASQGPCFLCSTEW
jgi:hypothetical protein